MRSTAGAAIALCSTMLAACGAGAGAAGTGAATGTLTQAACTRTARAELVAVARRVYDQAVSGRAVASATTRMQRSTALARAVAARDPRAVRAALAPLLKHQITRIDVTAGGRTLARMGSADAYAPVRGAIRLHGRVVGGYVLAVSDDGAFAGLVRGLTGATTRFGRRHHGSSSTGATLRATTFPAGHTTIALTLPALPRALCAATAADTRLNTIGLVARNVLRNEQHGPAVARAVRHAALDPAFRRGVEAGDPAAVRAAIVGFFRDSRWHIVRVRAWQGRHLIDDVGGPYVLSPALGTIRDAQGAPAGRFMLSVQDDTGFIKLVHRFTGAKVVLRTNAGTVPGSDLLPGPPFVPGLGTLDYRSVTYRSYGLEGSAFPNGRLRALLLVRHAAG